MGGALFTVGCPGCDVAAAAALFVGVADGAEMEEGRKVEALVRGSVPEPGAATVSGSVEWSSDCRACRVAGGGPGRAGVAAAAGWLIGGSCCGSGAGPGMLPSAAAAASPCPGPCGFAGPSAEPGPRRGGPGAGSAAVALTLGGSSGARCWEGNAEEPMLLLFRSADRKVGSFDELWFWRWVCGHAEDIEVEDDKDDEGVKVETAVAEELFLDDPGSSMETRRACSWAWAWPSPRATPLD